MRNLIISVVIFLTQSCSMPVHADDHEDMVHSAAHFGMSYAINTFVYGTMHKGLGCGVSESMFMSVLTTTLVGLTYKYVESNGPVQGLEKAVLWNGVGTVGSILTIKMFEF